MNPLKLIETALDKVFPDANERKMMATFLTWC